MTEKDADLQAALAKDAQLSEKLEKQGNELVEVCISSLLKLISERPFCVLMFVFGVLPCGS